MEGWRTPLFGPYYNQTGYVVAATGRAPQKAIDHLEKALSSISSHPTFAPEIRQLNGSKDFKSHTWQYTGPLTGFKGYFNRIAGYAHSADALKGIWEHCASRGVKFIMGESAGKAVELLYSDGTAFSSSSSSSSPPSSSSSSSSSSSPVTGSQKGIGQVQCIGVKTADGKRHLADLTICALGAYGASLIPSLGKFTVARCWSVAHVQLSEAETDYLRGIPTTNVRDLGFFFEPDPKTRLFKLCPLGTGYTNTNDNDISLPPADRLGSPQDCIPLEDEQKLRQLLRETFPWMAERPFVEQRVCWFADTADSEYCIDFVPGTDKSLVVLSGDSGHGFKMMPSFGKWVVELLEKQGQRLPRWQWRDADSRGQDWSTSVSWRIGTSGELRDVMEDGSRVIRSRL